jgi:4-amino-4-deoxy-L-arabinose transferase-like glycosyltransferase
VSLDDALGAERDVDLHPQLGEPFLDKPILFFWSQAASMRVVGETEAGVRLPGLVFGLLGALTTGWLAAVVLGHRGGWLAAPLYGLMF